MTGPSQEAETALPEPGSLEAPAPLDSRRSRREPPLSHEFGTPLNAILGNVALMLDGSTGPLSQQARDCLADVQAAGRDLLRQSRLLLLLIQALECPAPADERPMTLEDLFGDAFEQAHRRRDRLSIGGERRSATLIGDPFWLRALARCIVDLYLAAECAAQLRITVEQPPVLSIGWPGLETASIPASARAVICRITEMHGGRMHAAAPPALDLSWPAWRLCAGPRSGPEADNRIMQR